MKIHLLSPDAKDWIDPPIHSLLRQIPDANKAPSVAAADVTIVPVSFLNEFRFNESAMNQLRGKRWVLQDWAEFGWDWDQKSSKLWGSDRVESGRFNNEEYRKFDEFVRGNPPILTFQRELLEKDRTDRLLPIEYTAYLPESGADSKDDFLKRPIESLFNWGRSSETRMYMHAAFFSQSPAFGYDVISEWSHIAKALKENICGPMKIVSAHVPHFARIDVAEVQKFCRLSKVGVILNGCGVKTFRDGECCQDFIMARPKNNLAWSYPWDDSNSIVLPDCLSVESAQDAVKVIMDALMRPDLYELYLRSQSNASNYRYDSYLRRYVMANIERCM